MTPQLLPLQRDVGMQKSTYAWESSGSNADIDVVLPWTPNIYRTLNWKLIVIWASLIKFVKTMNIPIKHFEILNYVKKWSLETKFTRGLKISSSNARSDGFMDESRISQTGAPALEGALAYYLVNLPQTNA